MAELIGEKKSCFYPIIEKINIQCEKTPHVEMSYLKIYISRVLGKTITLMIGCCFVNEILISYV